MRCLAAVGRPAASFLAALAFAAGPACQSSGGGGLTGGIVLSVTGASGTTGIVGNVPTPCQLDVSFGAVLVGQTSTGTVTVTNENSIPVTLTSITSNLTSEFNVGFTADQEEPIAPGHSITFQVTFQPSAAGAVSASFSASTDPADVCGAASSSLVIDLSGTGTQPSSLSCTPNPLDFGNTFINTVATQAVTCTNLSTSNIDSIATAIAGTDADLFTLDNPPTTLPAGQSVTVDVSFAPTALETRSVASLTVSGSDGATATCILYGEPVGGCLTLAPNPIDFGYVQPGANLTACTVATNQCNVRVHINGADEQFGTGGGAFSVATTDDANPPNLITYPIAIQPAGSAEVCYNFEPQAIQQLQGQATWQTDDPSGNQPTVGLTGWGGGPEITCAPMSLSFGQDTPVGSSVTLPVMCSNSGSAIPGTDLLLDPPTASPAVFGAQFDQITDVYPINGLAPGQSARIDVTFTPSDDSGDTGTLTIQSNGGQGQAVQVPLIGQGVSLPPCQFEISPPALNFGNVQVGGTSVPLSFEIANLGTTDCIVDGLAIQDDFSGAFHVLSTSIPSESQFNRITIPAPGPDVSSELTVTLDFAPTEQGAFGPEVAFSISDPSDPHQVVALSGSSSATCLTLAPASLSFGNVGENGSDGLCSGASLPFSVFNACGSAVTLQPFTLQQGPGDLVAQFSIPAGPPLVLQPGDAPVVFGVSFEPTTVGEHTAQLLLSDGTVSTLLPLSGGVLLAPTETDTFSAGPPQADLLFIDDVGGSPTAQAVLSQGAGSFFQAGAGVDYRVAMTTDDDSTSNAEAEFGQLLPCPSCSVTGSAPTIISPSSVPLGGTAADPATVFADLLNAVPSSQVIPGAPSGEHFFIALYNALQRAPIPGVDFFRAGAYFSAITVNSDNSPDNSQFGAGARDVSWFQDYFQAFFSAYPLFLWNYFNPTLNPTGSGFSDLSQLPPNIQQMLQSGTGGVAVNSADPSWESALASVWLPALEGGQEYRLLGTPSGGATGFAVAVNGSPVADGSWFYLVSHNAVVFLADVAPATGSVVTVVYPIGCQ